MNRKSIANSLMNGADVLFVHVFFGDEYAILLETKRSIILHKSKNDVYHEFIVLSGVRQSATFVQYSICSDAMQERHTRLMNCPTFDRLMNVVGFYTRYIALHQSYEEEAMIRSISNECYASNGLYSDYLRAMTMKTSAALVAKHIGIVSSLFRKLLVADLEGEFRSFWNKEVSALTIDASFSTLEDKFLACHIKDMSDPQTNELINQFVRSRVSTLHSFLMTKQKELRIVSNGLNWKPTLFYDKQTFVRNKKNKADVLNDIMFYATDGQLSHERARDFLGIHNTKPFCQDWAVKQAKTAQRRGMVKYSLSDIEKIMSENDSIEDLR